jgi:hypothetical protein
MKNFDWQTEEVDDQLFTGTDPILEKKKSGWRRNLLVLVCVLSLISAVIYWQLDRRVDAQTAAFEADVLAAFQVWRQAVAQSDEEMFNTLLVGAHPAWATAQRSLFHGGFLINRAPLDLEMVVENDQLQIEEIEVELSPDWTSAEISFQQVYNIIDHPVDTLSTPRQIRLAYEISFQRNADRWFLASPPDNFWGERKTLEKTFLTITYPERDRSLALRLAQDLDSDLAAICSSQPVETCQDRKSIELRLGSENENLSFLQGLAPSLYGGQIFIIPTPSLIGRPIDDDGYDLLYQAYTAPILSVFSSWVNTPIPLPDQELQLLCYPPEGRTPKLIRFTSLEEWVVDLPDQSFRYLSPMPNDKGVVLQQYIPGRDSSHLRLMLWQDGQGKVVYDNAFSHLMLYPVGWSGPSTDPNLLLHGFGDIPTATTYSHLNLDACDENGCQVDTLDWFPVWSPDGRTIILQERNKLFLQKDSEQSEVEIGEGVSPFWIDDTHYGYIRYLSDQSANTAEIGMEIVTAAVNDSTPRQLLTTEDLLSLLPISQSVPAYINYITVNPANANELYLALIYFVNQKRHLEIFSVNLQESGGLPKVEEITLQLTLVGASNGYPSLVVPNGFVPFVVSPDGRWLSSSRLDPEQADTWIIYARDTELNQTYQYTVPYPSSMFIHPFYDWSKDGNWLVIVDQNYLRLISPAHNYERLITHDLQTCSHPAWIDPINE